MAVAESKSWVSDQMGKAVGAAKETLTSVVVETLVGLLDGSLESDGRCGASLILLQALLEGLNLILLALGECLAVGAGGESGNISVGSINSRKSESKSESGSSGSGAELFAGLLALCRADNASSGHRALRLGTASAKRGSESAPANF